MFAMEFFAVSCRTFMRLEVSEVVLRESSYCSCSSERISWEKRRSTSCPVTASVREETSEPWKLVSRSWNEG
jgi:hypothetical protein